RTKLRFTRNRLRGGRLRLAVVGEGVRKVTFLINGRRVAVDRKAPFRATVRLKHPGKRLRLTAVITLADRHRTALRRRLR
ncbi:MAG TPA: hypothetical protein VGW10_13710, partial [Solirubrobacteraceae bacterium]|nr:hypothetical protein [Solirubrobacteraceae bacterium]